MSKKKEEQLPYQLVMDDPSGYTPWGGCREAIFAKDKEVLVSGALGTGKSLAILWKLFGIASTVPGVRILICRKTRSAVSESVLVTWEEKVLGANNPIVVGPKRQYRHSYDFPNGAQVIVGGLDNPERILSTEYDIAYFNEVSEGFEPDWEALCGRLRNYKLPWQQMIGCCNPQSPTHWLKRRCDKGTTRYIHTTHKDNAEYFDHKTNDWTKRGIDYIHTIDTSQHGMKHERNVLGKWVAAEGTVYDNWDARVHLVDRFDIPEHWPKYRAIDYGHTNPFVCLWVALDNDKRMYLYKYHYKSQDLVEHHAEVIKNHSGIDRFICTIADHDASGNATMNKHGIRTKNAKKNILQGIELVQSRLQVQEDGKPRLMVLRDSLICPDKELLMKNKVHTLEEEFDSYCWPKSRTSINQREVPVDSDNHALDALRYLVMHLDYAAPVKIEGTGDHTYKTHSVAGRSPRSGGLRTAMRF